MAKPIPRKKKPVAKKKAKATSEISEPKKLKLTKDATARLEEIEENAQRRYDWALWLKKQQPEELQNVANRMTNQMARMAYPPTFNFNGVNYSSVVGEQRLRSIQYKNHLYLSMRMLVACAEWDIRIGNFKAPAHECIRCGKVVKKIAKKKKATAKKKVKNA